MCQMDTLGIIQELEASPALRAQLRAVLLGDEVLRLPELVAENTRAIARLTERMERVESQIQEQGRQIARLTERMERVESQIAALTDAFRKLSDDVGMLKGTDLERRLAANPRYWLHSLAGRGRTLEPPEVEDRLEVALDQHAASLVLGADLYYEANDPDTGTILLVVEASWRLERADLERTIQRLAILRSLNEVTPVGVLIGVEMPQEQLVAEASSQGIAVIAGRAPQLLQNAA